MEENDPHDIPIEDHIAADEEIECGYCGHVFSSHERRIEKIIYGRKWVFCSEECLEDFKDKSDFADENPDVHHAEDFDELTPEMKVRVSGPPIDEDIDDDSL